MKLQYLGDSRDAFKWDLLHHICSQASSRVTRLLFVPLLTADDPEPRDGRTPAALFSCRPEIRALLTRLGAHPRSFAPVRELGMIDDQRPFEVLLYRPERVLGSGHLRLEYWSELASLVLPNTVIFLDPDNGFETKTRRGEKWALHAEVAHLLSLGSVGLSVVVYQHRPQRRPWSQVLRELSAKLVYAPFAEAVYEPNLAFIVLTHERALRNTIRQALLAYVQTHPALRWESIREAGA